MMDKNHLQQLLNKLHLLLRWLTPSLMPVCSSSEKFLNIFKRQTASKRIWEKPLTILCVPNTFFYENKSVGLMLKLQETITINLSAVWRMLRTIILNYPQCSSTILIRFTFHYKMLDSIYIFIESIRVEIQRSFLVFPSSTESYH